MNISESGRYTINYKAQFFSQALEYGLIELIDNHSNKIIGALAKISPNNGREVQFAMEYSIARKRPAGLFAKQFGKRNDTLPIFAFNGSKTYDRSLVSQIGLDESYIGSPDSLLVYDSRINGIPIFNHFALLIDQNKQLSFQRINLLNGIGLSCNSRKVFIPSDNRNLSPDYPNLPDFVYYDADYSHDYIPGNGRSVILLGGASIREIFHTQPGINIPYRATGLALSIADEAFPPMWDMKDKDLEINLPGFGDFVYGVHGGIAFMQSDDGSLKAEYHPQWQKIFYPNLESEKAHLLCGIDQHGNILVVSLLNPPPGKKGLRLQELPQLLTGMGFTFAMMMDEGQGSSLYRGIERIHFSDNDHDANFNPFSDAPQPGTASNAIIVY